MPYSKNPIQILDLSDQRGRVFAIGDVHGQYNSLMTMLHRQNFSSNDHLILVGDLVDRGRGSFDVINFVFESHNVHSVMGNHEGMMADAYFPLLEKVKGFDDLVTMVAADNDLMEYVYNYGHWMYHMTGDDWGEFHAIMSVLSQLPYIIDIKLTKYYRVGVCHAHYPEKNFGAISENQLISDKRLALRIMWSRALSSRIQRWSRLYEISSTGIAKGPASFCSRYPLGRINNVDLMIHGHTVMPVPILTGNHLFLDTGGCFSDGYLSMVELTADGPVMVDKQR